MPSDRPAPAGKLLIKRAGRPNTRTGCVIYPWFFQVFMEHPVGRVPMRIWHLRLARKPPAKRRIKIIFGLGTQGFNLVRNFPEPLRLR
jgi:hypothetical protein